MSGHGAAPGADQCSCGCCEGVTARTPVRVENRPGLPRLDYRVGTHAGFKQSMLARLSAARGALAGLRTRDDDDLSIALLDAWATVADVATFYQERIVNESFLRTATERRSLVELTRLLGYRPRPGIAATTHLVFTIDDAPGAPPEVHIPVGAKAQSIPDPDQEPQVFETVEPLVARPEWNALPARLTRRHELTAETREVTVAGTASGLRRGDGLLVTPEKWQETFVAVVTDVSPDPAGGRTNVRMAAVPTATVRGAPASGVMVLRARGALFAHNAPDWRAMPYLPVRSLYDPRNTEPDWPPPAGFLPLGSNEVLLDSVYPNANAGTWAAVVLPSGSAVIAPIASASEQSAALYTVSGKGTRLSFDRDVVVAPTSIADVRHTTVYCGSEPLPLADVPIDEPVADSVIEIGRRVDGIGQGRTVVVSGEPEGGGDRQAEVATIATDTRMPADGFTRIELNGSLRGRYDRRTVAVSANVALATHGETVREVLGSGDAATPYLRFVLRQSPLTHLTAADAAGGAGSTLEVMVDGVRWQEDRALYGHGAADAVFVTSLDDEGRTSVQFGDARTGARPRSGAENVRATYRKGIGAAGNLRAGQLSLLLDAPLGVREVTNPQPSSGGADRDTAESTRSRAPLTVRTLDRVVSLRDYEDFALDFAGVAKAAATWTWDGQKRGVFLTVAAPRGGPVPAGSTLHRELVASLRNAGDATVPLRVQTFRPAPFRLVARVKVAPDRRRQDVLEQVERSLRTALSFEMRRFGESLAMSQVLAFLHAVPGVVAVDVDALYRDDQPARVNPRLPAAAPRAGAIAGTAEAAELLTLASVWLGELA